MYGYIIRNYVAQDAEKIGAFNKNFELSYKYNGDFQPENIFCAVSPNEDIYGVVHLDPLGSCEYLEVPGKPSDFIHEFKLGIAMNPQYTVTENIRDCLLQSILERAKQIKKNFPSKKIRVITNIRDNDKKDTDYFISKGFVHCKTYLILSRDLSIPIPEINSPVGIDSCFWRMNTEEEQLQYLEAEKQAFGKSWSLNFLKWMKAPKEWGTLTAFEGSEVAGSVMLWGMGPDKGAMEQVFVLPKWRKRGIAKYLITEGLKLQKERGKREVTLSVVSDNKRAIALYYSMGYNLKFFHIQFGIDVELP